MNRLSIKARLAFLVTGLLAMIVLSAATGMFRLREANTSIETIYNDRVVCLGQLKVVSGSYMVGIAGTAHQVRDGALSPADAIQAITSARARIDKEWKDYTSTYLVDHERELVTQAEPLMARANASVARLLELLRANDAESLQAYVAHDMDPVLTPVADVVNQLVQLQIDVAQQEYTHAHATYERVVRANVISVALILGVASMLCWTLIRSITRPLEQAVKVAETVAAGDLTSRIDVVGRDETSQLLTALKRMNDNLQGIVGEVRMGSEAIGSATQQIAAGNMDLSSRTEEQAASLEQTASSMDELTGTVRQNADNARQASMLASSASETAGRGSDVVDRVVGTMSEIKESSSKIAEITGMIEGIAFQTNILALNAAVEAVRAGEQGRGFAVVASEVRSLAQRSSTAAKEIKELIGTSVARVATGSELVERAGRTMQEIQDAVARVTDIMGEIAAASVEQSQGIEQVGHAISQMDDVTQQNAALVEQAAAAAQSLEDQATKLNGAVAVFKLA